MTDIEFKAWPKTPRLFRPYVITEKIDGTNGCVIVTPDGEVAAQSRSRIVVPGDDNYGFAGWVYKHSEVLAETLGPGYHYGEWWGRGIQRGYGMSHRRFSLFNTGRFTSEGVQHVPGLGVVPVLEEGEVFSTAAVERALNHLREYGSEASPSFMRPEGVVVYHVASRQVYKALLESDDLPKGLA